jgi:hypothetical protein
VQEHAPKHGQNQQHRLKGSRSPANEQENEQEGRVHVEVDPRDATDFPGKTHSSKYPFSDGQTPSRISLILLRPGK